MEVSSLATMFCVYHDGTVKSFQRALDKFVSSANDISVWREIARSDICVVISNGQQQVLKHRYIWPMRLLTEDELLDIVMKAIHHD